MSPHVYLSIGIFRNPISMVKEVHASIDVLSELAVDWINP